MITTINHDQLKRCLLLLWMADIPACIIGSVGTGKTTAVENMVKELDSKMEDKFHLWKVFLGLVDATDIGGIPNKSEDGKIDYMPPRCLPFDSNDKGIIFGDEYDRAAPDVQNAFNQILLGKEIHNNVISNNAYVILAMNGESDTYTTPLSKAARNRVCTLYLSSDATGSQEDWDEWARENNINDTIRGFAKYRPNLIVSDSEFTEQALITPRSRDMTGKILDTLEKVKLKTDDIVFPCLAGVIGTSAAHELMHYIEERDTIPDIKHVLENPKEYIEYFDRPHLVYIICIGVEGYVNRIKNEEQKEAAARQAVSFFTNYMAPEIQMWAVQNIVKKNADIVTSKEYKKFFNETKELI